MERERLGQVSRMSMISTKDSLPAEVPIFARLECGTCGAKADVELVTWSWREPMPMAVLNDVFFQIAEGQADNAKGWFIWGGKWRCGKHQIAMIDRP